MNIFISHSGRDKPLIREVIKNLHDNIKTWIDEKNIVAGDDIDNKIRAGIYKNADLIILFLSRDAVQSSWVKKEIELALSREKILKYKFLIPIIMDDDVLTELADLGFDLKRRAYLKCQDFTQDGVEAFARKLNNQLFSWLTERIRTMKTSGTTHSTPAESPNDAKKDEGAQVTINASKEALWVRISNIDGMWEKLEEIVIQAVIDGGITAMGYYRNARKRQKDLEKDKRNPSTIADINATMSILRTVDSFFKPISSQLDCDISYLGEETVYKDFIEKDIGISLYGKILCAEEFFRSKENSLRIIIDAIDGTANFSRDLPLFCSAVAIFVEDQLRASAIYDPIHNVVYSGLLPGSYNTPENFASAWAWHVSSGERNNLISEDDDGVFDLKNEALAVHFPRNNDAKLSEFIDPNRHSRSMLHKLCSKFGGIYTLNSGLFAMAEVASGGIGGFLNITTHPWDIAAGEVLVRACGGKVTDMQGNKIDYATTDRTGVIAAKGGLHEMIIQHLKE